MIMPDYDDSILVEFHPMYLFSLTIDLFAFIFPPRQMNGAKWNGTRVRREASFSVFFIQTDYGKLGKTRLRALSKSAFLEFDK